MVMQQGKRGAWHLRFTIYDLRGIGSIKGRAGARWAARWGTARCAGPRRVQRREPFRAPNLGQLRMVHHEHSVPVQRTESMRMQLVNGDRSLGEGA
jgi:hypothetical protein